MKKYLLLALVFCSVCQAQVVKKNKSLQVIGTQLCNQAGEPIQLRGMSFGWHNYWPRFYNQKAVKTLVTDWKCNVVRAAMGIEGHELTYTQNPQYATEKLETVVKAAIKNDIYVIADWHSHNLNLKEALVFFDWLSKKYGHTPNLIYEIVNEPDEETWPEVKAYAEQVIAVIRKNDPDNIILVGSPRWDQDVHLPAADPITTSTNLMYTMHFYAGTHEKWLRDRTDEALKNNLPIFVSESAGMEATGDGPLNEKAWQEYIDWMESRKISWIVWSVSNKEETCSVLKGDVSDGGPWNESELKPSGVKARNYIRSLNK